MCYQPGLFLRFSVLYATLRYVSISSLQSSAQKEADKTGFFLFKTECFAMFDIWYDLFDKLVWYRIMFITCKLFDMFDVVQEQRV